MKEIENSDKPFAEALYDLQHSIVPGLVITNGYIGKLFKPPISRQAVQQYCAPGKYPKNPRWYEQLAARLHDVGLVSDRFGPEYFKEYREIVARREVTK